MSHDWPGRWHSKCDTSDTNCVSFTNDHGVLWLSGRTDEAWLRMSGDVPENRC